LLQSSIFCPQVINLITSFVYSNACILGPMRSYFCRRKPAHFGGFGRWLPRCPVFFSFRKLTRTLFPFCTDCVSSAAPALSPRTEPAFGCTQKSDGSPMPRTAKAPMPAFVLHRRDPHYRNLRVRRPPAFPRAYARSLSHTRLTGVVVRDGSARLPLRALVLEPNMCFSLSARMDKVYVHTPTTSVLSIHL